MDANKNLVVIKCPECGSQLTFKPVPNYRIKKVTCPKCKHVATAGEYISVYDPTKATASVSEDVTRVNALTASIKCVETGQHFPLKNGQNTIGRKVSNPRASIVFDDEDRYMSKLHATISVVNAGGKVRLHLRDENSTNGTYINGKKVPIGSIVLLNPGTEFKMGNLTFVCSVPNSTLQQRTNFSEGPPCPPQKQGMNQYTRFPLACQS